jgi:hypothetical protein
VQSPDKLSFSRDGQQRRTSGILFLLQGGRARDRQRSNFFFEAATFFLAAAEATSATEAATAAAALEICLISTERCEGDGRTEPELQQTSGSSRT